MLPTAADESEVQGYIFRILDCLSMLAPKVGLDFEYIGAGSNRNFCFTDLLLRERGNTDLHLSAATWGIIHVKGPGSSVCLTTCLWQKLLTIPATAQRFCQLYNRPMAPLLLRKHLSLLLAIMRSPSSVAGTSLM